MKTLCVLISMSSLFVCCQHNKTDEIYPLQIGTTSVCDTLSMVSYNKDIVPIISSNCYSCHSGKAATAGLDMSNYETLKALAINDGHYLLNTVNNNPDYVYMPPFPERKLTTCEIAKIRIWTLEGAPKN